MCCMRQSSAFNIKKSTYILHRLTASSVTFPRKRTVGVKKVEMLLFFNAADLSNKRIFLKFSED